MIPETLAVMPQQLVASPELTTPSAHNLMHKGANTVLTMSAYAALAKS